MTNLVRKDFELVTMEDGHIYFRAYVQDLEVCIEPCFGGFDVAIYKNEELAIPDKLCTKSAGYDLDMFGTKPRDFHTWQRAIDLVNKLLKERS